MYGMASLGHFGGKCYLQRNLVIEYQMCAIAMNAAMQSKNASR